MNKLLVSVRHGEYGAGDYSSLSEEGNKQMENLRKVVDVFVAKMFGQEKITRVGVCFSRYPRAVESIQHLSSRGDDIVMTNLYLTEREDIQEPLKILEKVMGIASHYDASVVTVVAHGEMPSVLAETAHEAATGKKLDDELPYVDKGHGFIVNLSTGQVIRVGHDSLEEKQQAVKTRHVPEFVPPPPLPKGSLVIDFDDDIPF